MRLPMLFFSSLGLATLLVSAQVFPTLDPNAAPPANPQGQNPSPSQPKDSSRSPAGNAGVSSKSVAAAPDNGSRPENPADASAYVLGPQDTLRITVVDMDEIAEDPYPIDLRGDLTLPRIGTVHAAGLTVDQLRTILSEKFKEYLQEPVVSVNVAEYRSQPVSILGSVENPGVHQIRGDKTLFEVISEAGGLRDDAGNKITITRKLSNGPLPLASAFTDPTGRFSIADLNIRSVMSARNPADNISVKPYDVITVPKADLIYVIGAVKRPGGFPLQERSNMTVLEALSLAQGLDKGAASNRAKILRTDEATHAHTEMPVNVKGILDGKGSDQPLLSNDILFIPSSTAKLATYRALEAIVQTGTGIAIYRP